MLKSLIKELKTISDKKQATILKKFFKTGKGEYGDGDIFLGVTVPIVRSIAKKYYELNLDNIKELLSSKIHEERLCALLILVENFKKNNDKNIFYFYLDNVQFINNWDLVDLSADKIVGKYLFDKPRDLLFKLARSDNLWERRIAIISTFYFIKNNDFKDTLKISELLLNDKHDLIHKAVGWMLRETGKRDLKIEEDFLRIHYKTMPRTMLRYSIEKFDEKKRRKYLLGEINSKPYNNFY